MIIAGSKTQSLAARVSNLSGMELASVEYNRFPDGEQLVRIKDESDGYVVIASTPADEDYVELIQILDACSEREVKLVIPYMGYARQDDSFREGEPISARALARAISMYTDEVYTINIHNRDIHRWFECDSEDLDASRLLGESFSEEMDNPLVISPDEGARDMAREAASAIGCSHDYLEKERISGDEVELSPRDVDLDGMDVLLVDDIISTGGTMTEATRMVKRHGASSVYIGCIHPVFSGNSIISIYDSGVESIRSTDTLSTSHSSISVSNLITEKAIN